MKKKYVLLATALCFLILLAGLSFWWQKQFTIIDYVPLGGAPGYVPDAQNHGSSSSEVIIDLTTESGQDLNFNVAKGTTHSLRIALAKKVQQNADNMRVIVLNDTATGDTITMRGVWYIDHQETTGEYAAQKKNGSWTFSVAKENTDPLLKTLLPVFETSTHFKKFNIKASDVILLLNENLDGTVAGYWLYRYSPDAYFTNPFIAIEQKDGSWLIPEELQSEDIPLCDPDLQKYHVSKAFMRKRWPDKDVTKDCKDGAQ